MPAGLCIRGTICKYENRTLKVARNAFNIRVVWNPDVAMVTKLGHQRVDKQSPLTL